MAIMRALNGDNSEGKSYFFFETDRIRNAKVLPVCKTIERGKEIGDKEPYYSTKISIFSFIWTSLLLYTKQAQYNEGCAKLNYSLPEV